MEKAVPVGARKGLWFLVAMVASVAPLSSIACATEEKVSDADAGGAGDTERCGAGLQLGDPHLPCAFEHQPDRPSVPGRGIVQLTPPAGAEDRPGPSS
jgi:hypothetical protein